MATSHTSIQESSTDPPARADHVQFYSKDVGGVSQLFARASDGTIYQLTPTGGVFSPPEQWAQNDIAANQAAVVLKCQVSTNFDDIKMIRSGSIIGIRWRLTEARTAGELTVTVSKNGVAGTLSGVTDAGNASGGVTTQASGVDTFVAGDSIGVLITTDGAWAPTTSDIEVWLDMLVTL